MAVARTPEELETLLEDGFVLRDATAVADLFGLDGILVAGPRGRGRAEILLLTTRLCDSGRLYLAEPRWVIENQGQALIISDRAVSLAARDTDHNWRYAICVLLDHD